MKQLFLIRHAKSSWASPTQSDFDRPLNERGEEDAPLMGKKLKEMNIHPDRIIASSARRTRQTAKRIAKTLDFSKEKIELQERLYHCQSETFVQVINEVDNSANTIFIIAHNPGITYFANSLNDFFRIDNMPTCGVVGARFEAQDWKEFTTSKKEVFLFDYPKKY